MFSKVHTSKWIEWRKIVELNFLLINYDYLFVIFCDRIKYKATKKIFIRGWKLMNNNYGTQLNIMKRNLVNELKMQRAASKKRRYLGYEAIKKVQMKARWKLLFLMKLLSLTKLTYFTVSSSVSGFTLASVTSKKILTQGIVLTRRLSTLVYICI